MRLSKFVPSFNVLESILGISNGTCSRSGIHLIHSRIFPFCSKKKVNDRAESQWTALNSTWIVVLDRPGSANLYVSFLMCLLSEHKLKLGLLRSFYLLDLSLQEWKKKRVTLI